MTDPAFNLAQLERCPNWYQLLNAVEAAMVDEQRVAAIRSDAGWEGDEGGWYSPDGIHESDWEAEGFPLPEEDTYQEFIRQYKPITSREDIKVLAQRLSDYSAAACDLARTLEKCADAEVRANLRETLIWLDDARIRVHRELDTALRQRSQD